MKNLWAVIQFKIKNLFTCGQLSNLKLKIYLRKEIPMNIKSIGG
jgi:hypothetical protein